jgi:hypothetical protein
MGIQDLTVSMVERMYKLARARFQAAQALQAGAPAPDPLIRPYRVRLAALHCAALRCLLANHRAEQEALQTLPGLPVGTMISPAFRSGFHEECVLLAACWRRFAELTRRVPASFISDRLVVALRDCGDMNGLSWPFAYARTRAVTCRAARDAQCVLRWPGIRTRASTHGAR